MLKGRRRVETDRFVALRSHYLFASQFTTPGLEGAHEKGGVEGEVGRFRRNHLVPVPAVADLGELNAHAARGLRGATSRRRIVGRAETVGEAWARERPLLRALPAEPFDAAEAAAPRVDQKSLVTVRQNRYSVPVASGRAEGRAPAIGAREITISHGGSGRRAPRAAARPLRHQRRSSITTSSCSQRKPGALEHSLALAQERERGAWPACFDELWAALTERYGRSEAARADGRRRCCSAASTAPTGSRSPSAARSRPARIDGRAVAVLARRAATRTRPRRRR